ncbi:MAG: ABC transporter ATP-binding protein [Acidimicrobiia bacterium]
MTPLSLEARSLVKAYGDFTAVDDVSLEVRPGEVVGLLGANGAGKTTTIRMLVGLLKPTSGIALLLGSTPDRQARRSLGYVPQGLGLYRQLTVAENLEFNADTYGVQPAHIGGALAEARDRRVAEIPLGLQRQLAFVCALQHDPEVLVLDEPTSGVGPLSSARLWDEIRSTAEGGAGVLVSTHSMQEARQCDRLLLMADGAIVARGTEAEVVGDTHAIQVTTPVWREAFAALSEAGSLVTLDGRTVRVVDQSTRQVHDAVDPIDASAIVTSVPATIDERMAVLAAGERWQQGGTDGSTS